MPISKKITATGVVNAFSGTPDGTMFLRDDGTLATAGASYAKLVESGTNGGTITLYDDTATVGLSQLKVRSGAGQSDGTHVLEFKNNANTSIGGFRDWGDGQLYAELGDLRDPNAASFYLNWQYGLGLSSAKHVLFGASSYTDWDIGIGRSAAGILDITDGSTGQGGIGLSDAATTTVTNALILRHATSGTATTGFGTGLLFQGEDAAGNMQSMAQIQAVYSDATNASEDVELKFFTTTGGALTQMASIVPDYGGGAGLPGLIFVGGAYISGNSFLQIGGTGDLLFATEGVANRWTIPSSTGHFIPAADNAHDIGTTSAVVRNIYATGITVYDDTATTGASYITIRQGDVQQGAGPYPFSVYQNDGTTMDFAVSPELNTGWTGIRSLRYIGNTDSNFLMDPNIGLAFRNAGGTATQGINWNDTTYAAYDLQILRHTANVAIFTNGSTGIGSILSSRYVQAKAADYTVAVTDSSSVFTNEGTTTKNNFSLPTAAANLVYTFVVQDTDGLTVTANTGDTIQDNATVSASAGTIDSTDVGATVTLIAINATQWVVTSMTGTWAIT